MASWVLDQQRDAPVWVCCWSSPKLYNELSPETPLGNLNHSPSNIKAYGCFDMYEGKTGASWGFTLKHLLVRAERSLRSLFLFSEAAAPHGLNYCRAELILHRICINGGNAACHCEMSGPLSHAAPDSMVYCLCPGVKPQTYKSKVWAQSWGHLGRRAVQALHCHGQGTVPDSCSLTVNPPRQVGLLHRW